MGTSDYSLQGTSSTPNAGSTSNTGSSSGHTHSVGSLSGSSHTHGFSTTLNLDVQYVDIILAQKN